MRVLALATISLSIVPKAEIRIPDLERSRIDTLGGTREDELHVVRPRPQNPKPETRHLKPETRTPKPETGIETPGGALEDELHDVIPEP